MKTIIMATTAQYILSISQNYFGDIHVLPHTTSSGVDYFVVNEEYFDDGVENPY